MFLLVLFVCVLHSCRPGSRNALVFQVCFVFSYETYLVFLQLSFVVATPNLLLLRGFCVWCVLSGCCSGVSMVSVIMFVIRLLIFNMCLLFVSDLCVQ